MKPMGIEEFKEKFSKLGGYVGVPDYILVQNNMPEILFFTHSLITMLHINGVFNPKFVLSLEEGEKSFLVLEVIPDNREIDIFPPIGRLVDVCDTIMRTYKPPLVFQPSYREWPGVSSRIG